MAKKTKVQKEGDKWLKQSMTKKALKEHYKRDRNRALFDTSTKTFKSPKDYDRRAEKRKAKEAQRRGGAEEQTKPLHQPVERVRKKQRRRGVEYEGKRADRRATKDRRQGA